MSRCQFLAISRGLLKLVGQSTVPSNTYRSLSALVASQSDHPAHGWRFVLPGMLLQQSWENVHTQITLYKKSSKHGLAL